MENGFLVIYDWTNKWSPNPETLKANYPHVLQKGLDSRCDEIYGAKLIIISTELIMANEVRFMASSRWLTMCARFEMEDHKIQDDSTVCLPFLISCSMPHSHHLRRLVGDRDEDGDGDPLWASQQVSGRECRGACASLVIVFILNTKILKKRQAQRVSGQQGNRVTGPPIKQMTTRGLSKPTLLRRFGSSGTTIFGVDRRIVGASIPSFFSFMFDKIFIALFH